MGIILIQSVFGSGNRMFDPRERDGANEPFIVLRQRLHEVGYTLLTADDRPIQGVTWVLFWDAISAFPYEGLRGWLRWVKATALRRQRIRVMFDECIAAGLGKHIALFAWEPVSVAPENWRSNIHRRFPVIFTWNDAFVDGKRVHKVCCPVPQKFSKPAPKPFAEKKLLVNISMNKFSRHSRELYSARRESIRYFEHKFPAQFDLYGVGWDQPSGPRWRWRANRSCNFPSYRGPIRNKTDVLGNFRFALCYENLRDEPGQVTEKIFDIMRSGCVPIYWGASNVESYVDPAAFVDRRRFRSDAELGAFLQSTSESRHAEYVEAGVRYIASPAFERFLSPAFASSIIKPLGLQP